MECQDEEQERKKSSHKTDATSGDKTRSDMAGGPGSAMQIIRDCKEGMARTEREILPKRRRDRKAVSRITLSLLCLSFFVCMSVCLCLSACQSVCLALNLCFCRCLFFLPLSPPFLFLYPFPLPPFPYSLPTPFSFPFLACFPYP